MAKPNFFLGLQKHGSPRANKFETEIFVLAIVAVLCTAEGENGNRNRKYRNHFSQFLKSYLLFCQYISKSRYSQTNELLFGSAYAQI